MLGAIIGDIVGSVYEFNNIKTKDFDFWSDECEFTDDTVMTAAVANAILKSVLVGKPEIFKKQLIDELHIFGEYYPNAGYGGMFSTWIRLRDDQPYNSYGNGSAMRVSPCGFIAKNLDEALMLAKESAEVTHNHPEGIKGAQATAACIFLAKTGHTKEEIRKYTEEKFYKLDFTLDEIRDEYWFNETCQFTVPQAIEAFLEADSFEDAIRNAISIGGDSDTLAAITGGIAEAFFGIPENMKITALSYLDDVLKNVVTEFEKNIGSF